MYNKESHTQKIKGFGYLKYNPPRPGLKRRKSDSWLVLNVDNQISAYYRWWMKRLYGIELQHPMYGTHITLLDGRTPIKQDFKEHWGKYENKKIWFEYSPIITQHWKFFTLDVECKEFQNIRSELGFKNDIPFHITIGRLFDD